MNNSNCCVIMAGDFGLGFERLLYFMPIMSDIHDVIPFSCPSYNTDF